MRKTFVKCLTEYLKKNKNLYLLTGDLGFSVFEEFEKEFPNRFINTGIAEQNMMSVAAGLASTGKKVFVYSIGNFVTLRCFEQIRNDVCFHNVDVNIVTVGAGISYSAMGFTHHLTEDISCMRALPNMSIYSPYGTNETKLVVNEMLNNKYPKYMRLGNTNFETNIQQSINEPILYHKSDNSKLAIIATGNSVKQAMTTVESNKKVSVYSVPKIKPLPNLLNVLKNHKNIITVEDNQLNGGFGSSIIEKYPLYAHKIHRIGINDTYVKIAGSNSFLNKKLGISAVDILKTIENIKQVNKSTDPNGERERERESERERERAQSNYKTC
jgi:transketolase